MSYRRSLSFSDNEKDLLDYFDNNGKSDIAKEAMKFYKEHKDNVITEGMIKLLKIIGINNSNNIIPKNNDIQNKLMKLKK